MTYFGCSIGPDDSGSPGRDGKAYSRGDALSATLICAYTKAIEDEPLSEGSDACSRTMPDTPETGRRWNEKESGRRAEGWRGGVAGRAGGGRGGEEMGKKEVDRGGAETRSAEIYVSPRERPGNVLVCDPDR